MSILKFDASKLFNTQYGITEETQSRTASQIEAAVEKVTNTLHEGGYGFVETLSDESYVRETKAVFEKIGWAKTMVVVGIGGSDLGARAIQQALQADTPPMRVIFHGDSTDPEQIRRLQLQINLNDTVFVIISKSGTTVETISQYIFWKDQYRDQQDWARHFIFITDREKGVLRTEANTHSVLTLPIPDSVGGRFSVLTPVGLLPALAMGVDIDGLIQGARSFIQSEESSHLAHTFAATQFQLLQQGVPVTVFMPYSVLLEEFARWFRQLWAESLGKNGTGMLPVQARGPADQHSQVQFYMQGAPIMSLLFIAVKHPKQDFIVPETDITEVQYISGHSFQEIILAEYTATAQALHEAGRPSVSIELESLDAFTLGACFMFFELAVVVVAELLQVNAFDQPGVEQGKQIMRELL